MLQGSLATQIHPPIRHPVGKKKKKRRVNDSPPTRTFHRSFLTTSMKCLYLQLPLCDSWNQNKSISVLPHYEALLKPQKQTYRSLSYGFKTRAIMVHLNSSGSVWQEWQNVILVLYNIIKSIQYTVLSNSLYLASIHIIHK